MIAKENFCGLQITRLWNLRVNLEERCDHGHILSMDDVLGVKVIKELKAKVIANIEKNISDLLDKLEKL